METLSGVVERITFYNPDSGYTVLRLQPDSKLPDAARDGTVTVVGIMPELAPGETVRFDGVWVSDPRYGRQFRAEMVQPFVPTTEDGLIAYLSSGIVRGIGPRTAERIVQHFGDQTVEVLTHQPDRLREVLKPALADKLAQAWADNQAARQTLIFLQGCGISSRIAARIYKEYGAETIARVTADPYQLADDVFGIGFIRADAIARKFGVPPEAPGRLRAGLHYTLNRLSNDGHTYAPRPTLIRSALELLEIEAGDGTQARLSAVLDGQIAAGELIQETVVRSAGDRVQAVYLPLYHRAEVGAAYRLRRLAEAPSTLVAAWGRTDWEAFLGELARRGQVALTPQQQAAVKAALTTKISVLTGGPGTGKTTTLQLVIQALESVRRPFKLASPTGRAAKRLSEATGQPASTIHRLLGFSPDGFFLHDEEMPLEADLVVIDEASMLDLLLFDSLLKALRPTTHLLLVGDVDQLPSVGAGSVLRDVIASGLAHVTRLDTIFRQDEHSLIVWNAHRVNQGQMPVLDNRSDDFFFFSADDPRQAANLVVDIVANRLPAKFGIDPVDDVQVIAPMYRGPVGVHALNEALQQALNGSPRRAEKRLGGRVFRAGDKVIQLRNNYEKDVFNGDIGRITGINFDDGELEVLVDGRYVYYDWSEADELTLAYCISTHRSQGGEYPVVVLPLHTQHYMLLQRNLLYTAITRARRMVVVVGMHKAIFLAVQNNRVTERYGLLLERLQGRIP